MVHLGPFPGDRPRKRFVRSPPLRRNDRPPFFAVSAGNPFEQQHLQGTHAESQPGFACGQKRNTLGSQQVMLRITDSLQHVPHAERDLPTRRAKLRKGTVQLTAPRRRGRTDHPRSPRPLCQPSPRLALTGLRLTGSAAGQLPGGWPRGKDVNSAGRKTLVPHRRPESTWPGNRALLVARRVRHEAGRSRRSEAVARLEWISA